MKRFWKRLRSVSNLVKSFGFWDFVKSSRFNNEVNIINDFKEMPAELRKVLILAPHPDDDVLGVGGTILKMNMVGIDTKIVYLCDGAGGVVVGEKPKYDGEKLIYIRKEEAKKAAEILDTTDVVFWDYPDGKLGMDERVVDRLKGLIFEFKPDIIFLPHPEDNHEDHRALSNIVIKAMTGVENPELWLYEVWTPLHANRIVNINDVVEAKKDAIQAHQSQIAARDYTQAILGLNQYRAQINNLSGFAEGFFATNAKFLEKIIKI